VKAKTRAQLKSMLRAGTKKVIITTIFRFGDESAKQEANRLLRWTNTRLRKGLLDEAETLLVDCAELLASLKPDDGQTLRERFASHFVVRDGMGEDRAQGVSTSWVSPTIGRGRVRADGFRNARRPRSGSSAPFGR
jgi:hypothetical protein